jgi:hypothetical protein
MEATLRKPFLCPMRVNFFLDTGERIKVTGLEVMPLNFIT